MSQINKYPNKEAYAADNARIKTRSAVSYIENDGELVYDGVNVLAGKNAADIGDLAVFDKTEGAIKFIKGATLVKEQLPPELVPLAVVYGRRGDRVRIVSLDNATYNGSAAIRWAAPYEVALSGFNLAEGGTFVLRINTTEYSFTYAAGATLADIAANIAANLPNYGNAGYGGWTAAATDQAVILTSNTYSAAWATIEAVSGCEMRRTPENKNYQTTLTDVLIEGTMEYVRRKNGNNFYYGGCNPEKFVQYYSANGNANTNVPLGSTGIIRESVFTEADNPALAAAYPTYKDYLLGEHTLQYPAAYGALLRNGRENTAKIGPQRFTDIHGRSVPYYPAAAAALVYGVTVEGATTGLEAGAWWLPSVEEVHLLMQDRVLTAADAENDPVNRTLLRLGKASCYGSGYYPWTSCEHNSNDAYVYHGYSGCVGSSNKCGGGVNSVRLVSEL